MMTMIFETMIMPISEDAGARNEIYFASRLYDDYGERAVIFSRAITSFTATYRLQLCSRCIIICWKMAGLFERIAGAIDGDVALLPRHAVTRASEMLAALRLAGDGRRWGTSTFSSPARQCAKFCISLSILFTYLSLPAPISPCYRALRDGKFC